MAQGDGSAHVRGERVSARALAAVLISLALHAAVFFGLPWTPSAEVPFEIAVPKNTELGLGQTALPDPGETGRAAPAAPAPVAPPRAKPERKPVPRDPDGITVSDAGAPQPDAAVSDASMPDGNESGLDGGVLAVAGSDGQSLLGGGLGLGFGAGGFGSGRGGGGPGVVVGLHADLERVAATSLVLETEALLNLIPAWQDVLAGSGLDPLSAFKRVFVATPSLTRSSLVITAKVRGGQRAIERAVQTLAKERGQAASFREQAQLRIAPWLNRGPTQRVAGVTSGDQVLIARPEDLDRVSAVAAALAVRHARQPGMEHATGPAALLAMYEGEAVALSIEGVRAFAPSEADLLPLGLRVSLRHIDEYYAQVRLFGYYESSARAQGAADRFETLRPTLVDHPRAMFLGLQSAIREATVAREGATLTIDARVTLHQTRYLMQMITRQLKPKG